MHSLKKKIWLPVLTLAIVGSFFAMTNPAGADPNSFSPEIPIPGTEFAGEQPLDNDLFGRYVRAIYIYFIWVVGIVATFMVIYAGVRWVAAAGDQGRIREAREIINNAIIGVIIGLTSVVLLNLLSPGFTTLSIPGTTQVTKLYYEGAAVTRVCNPDRDGNKYQLQCGAVRIIGTRENKDGKTVNEFCMGTICDNRSICQIGKNTTTGFYVPGNGCVKRVEVVNPPADFKTQTSLPVVFGSSKQCNPLDYNGGLFENERFSINMGCTNIKSLRNLESACYMLSTKATIVGSAKPYSVQDMQCPI